MTLDAVLTRIDDSMPAALDRLMALLRIRSISTDPAYKLGIEQAAGFVAERLRQAGLTDVTYCEIGSTYGHDAFLVEIGEQTQLIRHFLEKTYYGYDVLVSHDA